VIIYDTYLVTANDLIVVWLL